MKKVQVITDSCSDLSQGLLEKYGLDYAKMSTVCEGVQSPAILEWSLDQVHSHYGLMRSGQRIFTSQVSVEEFERIFEKYLSKGLDIVYVGCSLKQSGSVNTARMCAELIKEKYPERQIVSIDSMNASLGEGMLAIRAAELAAKGLSAVEIEKEIIKVRKNVNQYVTVHSLEYLKRAGRVKGNAAFFGGLIGVKPIIISDKNGDQMPVKKVKGRHNSLKEIVLMLKDSIVNPEDQTIYVAHADCTKEEIDRLVEEIKANIPCKNVEISVIGPIIGASIGPDAVGIWGFGKSVDICVEE